MYIIVGGNKLYLDPYVVPLQNKDLKSYVFSLEGQEDSDDFFRKNIYYFKPFTFYERQIIDMCIFLKGSQGQFIECDIIRQLLCDNIMKERSSDNEVSDTERQVKESQLNLKKNTSYELLPETADKNRANELINNSSICDEKGVDDFSDEMPSDENGNSIINSNLRSKYGSHGPLIGGSSWNCTSPLKNSGNANTHEISVVESENAENHSAHQENPTYESLLGLNDQESLDIDKSLDATGIPPSYETPNPNGTYTLDFSAIGTQFFLTLCLSNYTISFFISELSSNCSNIVDKLMELDKPM